MSTDTSAAASDSSRQAEWQEVEVFIKRECRMGDVRSALRQADRADVTPAECRAIAEYWLAGWPAWGVGALHFRLRNAAPGEPTDCGWPARKATGRATETANRLSDLHASKAAAEAEAERLERDYGEQLDAFDSDTIEQLIQQASLGHMDRRSSSLRLLLLDHLRQRVEGLQE